MSARWMIALLLSLSAAPPVTGLVAAETVPDKRPNILFAFADDWGRYASAYATLEPGGPSDVVRTPHFDRVAREGALFTHAFVNAPSCTPCRSSLLSGQYFWRTGLGAILQGAVWDPKIPTYPLLLKDAGYHIGHTYKVWAPGTPVNAPYGGNALAYVKRGGHMNDFSEFVSKADDRDAARRQIMDEVRGNFRDFVADGDGRPFCYWFGPTNTHRKWIQGSGKDLWGIDPDSLKGKMPPYMPDVPAVREDFADYLGEAQAFDMAVGTLLEELEGIGQLDNTIVVVSGDHGIPGFPRGKCNLYDLGVEVSLAIRWGKNIPSGRVVDDFVTLPDLAPTFVEAAGLAPPAVMTGRSLLPVLKSEKSGLVDPTRTFAIVGRERHVAAAREGFLPYPQRAIHTRDFVYIRNFAPERMPLGDGPGFNQPLNPMPEFAELRENTFAAYADMDASPTKAWIATHRDDPGMAKFVQYAFGPRPAEELYDLRTDPGQLDNLAGDPVHGQVQKELSDTLMKVLKDTGDPRVTGDGTTYEKPPFAGEPGPRQR
ncbi:MAG: sulfatase family protein [Thermoguttaceae bacterium]